MMVRKKTKKVDWRVLIAIVAAITILEAIALMNGINGKLYSIVLAMLGTIAGLSLPQIKLK